MPNNSTASDGSSKGSGPPGLILRILPAIDSLRNYSYATFRSDFVAGLTVAAVAVPQAMAYATIVGLPVQYGLYTAIVMTAVGALLDSSKQLINGPTNAISIATLSAIGSLPLVTGDERIAAAILLAVMVGVIQIAISLIRLGDLSRYISHAVIVGFTVGAALLLVLDQLKNLLGLKAQGAPHDHFLKRWWLTHSQHQSLDSWTLTLGVGTMVFVLIGGWLNRKMQWRIPELLLAVILAATIVWTFDLAKEKDAQGKVIRGHVEVVGKIPRGLPQFAVPNAPLSYVRELADSAGAIALLGLLEAISMAKAIASRTKQRLDINQQCLSEGVANLVGGFFSCYPGSGSLTRSAINHQAGGKTQWSGVISAIAVAATMMMFAPLARYIPRTALAGILIISAFRMVNRHKFAYHMRVTRFDAVIVIATAVAAVAVSVEFCIVIGTFVSFLIYLPRAARVEITELVVSPDGIRERKPGDAICDRLLIYNLQGEFFFGSGPDLEQKLDQIEERLAATVRVVVLRLKYARNLDGVCLDILEQFIERLEARGVTVLLCGVRARMVEVLRNVHLEQRLGGQRIFPEAAALWSSTQDAVHRAYELLDLERCDTCPNREPSANVMRDRVI